MNELKNLKSTLLLLVLMLLSSSQTAFATEPTEGEEHSEDPIEAMMHHIGDVNEFQIIPGWAFPLPCIAWSEDGLMMTMSSSFEHGKKAVNGYVLYHGVLKKIVEKDFPTGVVEIHLPAHGDHQKIDVQGEHQEVHDTHNTIMHDGKTYHIEGCKALQNNASVWYDFSITKNVFCMLLILLLLVVIFSKVSKGYTTRDKEAPKGLQSLMEPLVLFIRDDVVKPAIGEKWQKFFPFIMCLFFFILGCNLLGLVPFFPGSCNITGNVGVTIALALFVFVVVTINGKKDYWQHIFWMPGVPTAIKPVMTIIEVMGIFIKPATLFIRLFANMTAGHVLILSIVSMIFFFNENPTMVYGLVMPLSLLATFALNLLELFIAFLQAFVFALLAAIYIGAAIEEHHHEEAH
jgi:F-type H+-transporting ATPase subunit a